MSSMTNISPRHMELLAAVIKNLKSTEVDWETVATDANYKTAKYARDEYRKIRDKLQGSVAAAKDDGGAKEASENGVGKKGGAKKRKAATEKTPVKEKKAKKALSEDVVKPEPEDDEGEEGGVFL